MSTRLRPNGQPWGVRGDAWLPEWLPHMKRPGTWGALRFRWSAVQRVVAERRGELERTG